MSDRQKSSKKSDDLGYYIILCGFMIIVYGAVLYMAKVKLGSDFSVTAKWLLAVLAMGVSCYPLSASIFSKFTDKGWMFSKAIGIALCGWLMWLLSSVRLMKFTELNCVICIGIVLALNIIYLVFSRKKLKPGTFTLSGSQIVSILAAETVFLLLFAFWLYLRAFKPEAYGYTEKIMDFGFMQSMYKSDYMPPEDMWLSGNDLNYYYVGQFLATYITKVSGVGVEYGYNLMLMMLAALGFSYPCSIAINVAKDSLSYDKSKHGIFSRTFPYIAGTLAGLAVSFSGNFQYVIFAKVLPNLRALLGLDKLAEAAGYSYPTYWFPNATRYIGYNPETNDKTIHEFPLYSFVLGDLHAHVINIMFVLTVMAVLYAFLQYRKERMDLARQCGSFVEASKQKGSFRGIPDFASEAFHPCILLVGFFIGLFHTTNFWDFPIYFVVAGAVILFSNAVIYNFSWLTLKLTLVHAVVVLGVSKLVCLPFTISFKQISNSICLCDSRTPLYQLVILWGLPIIVVFTFLGILIKNESMLGIFDEGSTSKAGKKNSLYRFIAHLEISDLFMITLGLCAVGLIFIPEVIYVKDIYSGSYRRANTMFKLTYQAFIMFGICMGYVIAKLLYFARFKRRFWFGFAALVLLVSTMGYFGNSTKAWFGDISDGTRYQGLDSGEYLKHIDSDDYYATKWINENIEGRPVMLEANGDSYTDYCTVSARTGLPTVLGWKTHEWLWQSDGSEDLPSIVSERTADIATIYTGSDISTVSGLIDKYNIEYIYVGHLEREKYDSADYSNPVNHELLQSLGEVIYPSDFSSDRSYECAYIIKVN